MTSAFRPEGFGIILSRGSTLLLDGSRTSVRLETTNGSPPTPAMQVQKGSRIIQTIASDAKAMQVAGAVARAPAAKRAVEGFTFGIRVSSCSC